MNFAARGALSTVGASLFFLAMGAPVAFAQSATGGDPACAALAGFRVSGGAVVEAQSINGGLPPPAERMTVANFTPMPSYCRVKALVSSGPGSKINIEVWLPSPSAWNGKFLGTGNGAFGGAMPIDWLSSGVRLGYATANTDMGTADAGGYDGGVDKPELIKDWGWRSTRAMTLVGKEVTRAYFSRSIATSLFAGCSTGGHQALMEAQRFPEDYDGILAGAAGNHRIGLHLAFLYYPRLARDNAGYWLSRDQALLVRKRVVAACAGKGSGLSTDDFVANPGACGFNPSTLLCRAGEDPKSCLTPPQVAMVQSAYKGVLNPANGRTIYPGIAYGAEASLLGRLPAPDAALGSFSLINWAKGKAFNAETFDFNKDAEELFRTWGEDINAVSPDLSAFAKRGGKLIMYHGWEDTTVSPYDSIGYYSRLAGPSRFARLFMVPGMGHCLNGPGFDSFGARSVPGQIDDPAHNIILALDQWVTKGIAPERIIATKWSAAASRSATPANTETAPDMTSSARKIVGTRPLCPYPKVARYNGAGDAAVAENFTCAPGPKAKFKAPAQEYLRNGGAF